MIYQMVAHQDACTDLAIDPTSLYLLSASNSNIIINLEIHFFYQPLICIINQK